MAIIPGLIGQAPTLAEIDAVVTPTVAGYYRFDGDVLDETANNNDLTNLESYQPSWLGPHGGARGAWIGGADLTRDRIYQALAATALQIDGDITVFGAFAGERNFNPTGTDEEVFQFILSNSTPSVTGAAVRYGLSWVDEGLWRYRASNGAGSHETFNFVATGPRTVAGVPTLFLVRTLGTAGSFYVNDGSAAVATFTRTAATGNGTGNDFTVGFGDADHAGCLLGLGVLDGAIGTSEIDPLFDLYRQNIVTEFTPVRSVLGASVDINQLNAQVYVKDVAGGAVAFTISNPLLHRMTTVFITDSVGGGSISLPGSVRTINGEAPSDLNPLSNGVDYILQIYCDDEVTPEYWASFRRQT